MSDTKFTKGEWNIKTTAHYFNGNWQYRHEVLVNDTGVTCRDSATANGNLIKTSPKMYEMLGELSALDECQMFKQEIKKLLAEARGEL